MFKEIKIPAAFALGIFGTAAGAQDSIGSAAGWFFDGFISHSYVDFENDSDSLTRYDVEMGVRPGEFSGLPIGFMLGIEGYRGDNANDFALYPVLTWGFGDHLISVGAPRPALEANFMPQRYFANSYAYDLEIGDGSYLTTLNRLSGAENLGLRWDGRFGNTQVAASINDLGGSGPSHAKFYNLAIRQDVPTFSALSDVAFFAGIENIDPDSGNNLMTWHLGAQASAGAVGFGLRYTDSELFGFTLSQVWLDWNINENFTAGLDVVSIDQGGPSDNLYGLNVAWKFANRFEAILSHVHSDNASSTDVTEATLRYEF